jgi:predicted  nucleic acid-binding Zn-ribbon protein
MSYSNYPSASPGNEPSQQPPKDNRKLVYGILIAALVGTWGYIIYDKNKSGEQIKTLTTQYTAADSSRSAVESEYNDALARMDSLTGTNTKLKGDLAERQASIDSLKDRIRIELNKKNGDIKKAHNMIAELNGKITDLLTQIDQLKQQNQTLTTANTDLTNQRDTLTAQKTRVEQNLAETDSERAHIQDVGSTLHASNINITAINIKGSGKEKVTSTAKRADVFRISFDLDENRIAASGTKELYVCVTAPDGHPITIPANGSGSFQTREEGEKVFTNKVDIQYEQGKRTPVSFDWKPENGKYQTGDYKIQIYQNGYKIGEGTKSLKKGGLFG